MTDKIIVLENALQMTDAVWIDVRSPSEFAVGHIPGAVNIPLFSDSERATIGTIYKQIGQKDAKQQGLSIVAPKLPTMIERIQSVLPLNGQAIIYCWRGGMRSRSVVQILDIMNLPAYQLEGGYKAHRRYVLDTLQQRISLPPVYLLCGSTGAGKTILLNLLAEKGLPVLDLEKLANHRGSVFGQIGLGESATAQNFDAQLLLELQRLRSAPYILIECESKRIGKVYLPDILYKSMQTGKMILAETTIPLRVSRLIQEYTDIYSTNQQAIVASLQSLNTRLGGKKVANLLRAFASGNVDEVVTTLLIDYYDPLYGYDGNDKSRFELIVNTDDLEQAAEQIACYLNKQGGNTFGNGG